MANKKYLGIFIVLLLLSFVVTACGGGKQPANQQAAQQPASKAPAPAPAAPTPAPAPAKPVELKKIVIAFPSAGSLSVLPIAAAEQQGFYAQEGFKIEYIEMKPPVAVPAAAAGEVDYITPMGSGISATIQGLPIRTVLVATAKPMHYLVAKKEITSMEQLKGKIVAVNAIGDLTDIEFQQGLQKVGMKYTDFKIMAISGAPPKIAAMESNQVDAAILEVPHNVRALGMGYNQLMSYADIMPAGTGSLATGTKKLEQNPGEVLKIVKATLRGTQWLKNNRDAAVALAAEWSKYDKETAAKAYDLAIADDVWPSNGMGTDASLKASLNSAKKQAQVDPAKDIPLDSIFDFKAVKQAAAELGIK